MPLNSPNVLNMCIDIVYRQVGLIRALVRVLLSQLKVDPEKDILVAIIHRKFFIETYS